MRPEQQTTISGKSSYANYEFGTVLPKKYFNVVNQENKVHHVKLGIFPPRLHIKFIKFGATVIKL